MATKSFLPTTIEKPVGSEKRDKDLDSPTSAVNADGTNELEEMLYAQHAEINSLEDLTAQRGTSIPAIYNQVYKFIQNPSSVSVETFKRMVDTDDTVGSGVDFLTTCLAARMGEYTHKNEDISKEINKRLNLLQNGWVNTMKEILSASWAGFSVSEKVWENSPDGFWPKKIITLPPQTILFETERTGELTYDGILQYQRNYNPAMYGGGNPNLFGFISLNSRGFRPDPYAKLGDLPFPMRTPSIYSYLSIRIPVEKCIHYSFDAQGKFGNPYGRSLLRRAYKHWVLKDAVLQMLATALDRKGTPLTVVYVDPAATFIDTEKVSPSSTVNDKDVGIRAQAAVKRAFDKIHNDSVLIMPGKKDQFVSVDPINQQSNAGDFISALDFLNKSIMRALLIPSLIFANGDGAGSFALGQEHAKTFDKILDGFLSGFQQNILEQLIKPMLAYNFPEELWKKDGLGEFSRRELSQDERQKELETVEKAVNIGAVDINDLEDLNIAREKAGFPARTTPIERPEMDLDNPDDPDANPEDEEDPEDKVDPKPKDDDSNKE